MGTPNRQGSCLPALSGGARRDARGRCHELDQARFRRNQDGCRSQVLQGRGPVRPKQSASLSGDPPRPRRLRHSPIDGILLTNGDLDHTLGLLCLRESYPLVVYATEAVRRGFVENNVLYRTLQRFSGQVTWRDLPIGREVELSKGGGAASGLSVEAFAVPGKVPVHLEGLGYAPGGEENVGFRIRERQTGRVPVYLSAARGLS